MSLALSHGYSVKKFCLSVASQANRHDIGKEDSLLQEYEIYQPQYYDNESLIKFTEASRNVTQGRTFLKKFS